MIISIIAAMDQQRAIGIENRLPWNLPADMQWFRKNTLGKPIIMGRTTFESIGKPLPGRQNIVVTRNRDLQLEGTTVVFSLEQAIAAAEDVAEVMIVGGANIYQQALPLAHRLYLTEIHQSFEADSWFPDFAAGHWQESYREDHPADDKNPHPYSFVILVKTAQHHD